MTIDLWRVHQENSINGKSINFPNSKLIDSAIAFTTVIVAFATSSKKARNCSVNIRRPIAIA